VRKLLRASLVFAAALVTCTGGGPPVRPLVADDHDRMIALMGGIDSHLLEIQRGAGDPLEPEYIQKHLTGMREKFERAKTLDLPHATFRGRASSAIDAIAELERRRWTRTDRDDGYAVARGLCAPCHKAYAPPADVPTAKPTTKDSCGKCHPKILEDWQKSLHGRAWTDPDFRMAAGTPPKMECRGCHSMEPILAREIATDVSYRPVYRPYHQEEGVNCLSCHGLSDGSVASSRDVPGAPCRPRRDDRLRTPEFCAACHNPTHLVYDEWKMSKSGKTCTDCHAMRDGKFSHRMRGVDDPDFVRSGLDWSCRIDGGELRISLTNRSGHRLPAEVPTRLLRVKIRIGDAEEEIVFRRPMKPIVGEKDNRLWPDETRVLSRPADGKTPVKVEIRYQQSMFAQPKDWIVIGRWEKP
jgi:hypothetical protein